MLPEHNHSAPSDLPETTKDSGTQIDNGGLNKAITLSCCYIVKAKVEMALHAPGKSSEGPAGLPRGLWDLPQPKAKTLKLEVAKRSSEGVSGPTLAITWPKVDDLGPYFSRHPISRLAHVVPQMWPHHGVGQQVLLQMI